MEQAEFDKQEQYDRIVEGLLEGERVLFVYDATGAGTGFIGVTDRRVVIQDNSFVGKKVALTSVPYTRVNAVSFVSDKSMFGKVRELEHHRAVCRWSDLRSAVPRRRQGEARPRRRACAHARTRLNPAVVLSGGGSRQTEPRPRA